MSISSATQHYIDASAIHTAPNYLPLPVVLAKAKGVWAWDVEGKKYLDMMSAYSAVSVGHGHPRILEALNKQAAILAVTSRAYYSTTLTSFVDKICALTGLDLVLPMNTGAEAVETAIKAARKWGYVRKNIPENQAEIIVAANNFHGRTVSIISFSSEAMYQEGFGPFTPGFKIIPFADPEALENAITPHTCAFLIEPIQGEAGIIVPQDGYLRVVREICTKHNVLLMLDEIQSGLARTGRMFAYEYDDILPDVLTLGKALGGGVLPVSATVAKKEVLSLLTSGTHGSTFGGNALSAAVGLEALRVIEEEKLSERSAELGQWFMNELRSIKSSAIKDIRGKGLWVGMELDPEILPAKKLVKALLERGILTKETHERTIRFAPPLVIEKKELNWALEHIDAALRQAVTL